MENKNVQELSDQELDTLYYQYKHLHYSLYGEVNSLKVDVPNKEIYDKFIMYRNEKLRRQYKKEELKLHPTTTHKLTEQIYIPVYLCVDKIDNQEKAYTNVKPYRESCGKWYYSIIFGTLQILPDGFIKQYIGKSLTWNDEPVEVDWDDFIDKLRDYYQKIKTK